MAAIYYLKLWALRWKIDNGPCLNQDCRACLLRARFGGGDAEVSPPAPGPVVGKSEELSPLTRGPRSIPRSCTFDFRITPAYAGTTPVFYP